MSKRQGMLSWELRTAMTLATLWRDQDRAAEGAALVDSIYQRFTDGFETPDLVQAADLLAALDSQA
jgi:hypothetical protein